MDKQTNIALRKTLDQIGASHSLKGYTYTIRAIHGFQMSIFLI